ILLDDGDGVDNSGSSSPSSRPVSSSSPDRERNGSVSFPLSAGSEPPALLRPDPVAAGTAAALSSAELLLTFSVIVCSSSLSMSSTFFLGLLRSVRIFPRDPTEDTSNDVWTRIPPEDSAGFFGAIFLSFFSPASFGVEGFFSDFSGRPG